MDESNEASLHSDVSSDVVTDAPVRRPADAVGQSNSPGLDGSFADSVRDNLYRSNAGEGKDNQGVDNQLLSCDSLSSEASAVVESSETETQSDEPKSESSPTKSSKSNRHVSFSASPSVYPIENLSEYNSYEPRSSMCRSSSSSDRLRFLSGCDVITAAPSSSAWSRGVTQVPQICKVLDAQPQKCIMSKAIITSTPLADIRDVSRISSEGQNMGSFQSFEDSNASADDGLCRSSSNFRSKIPGFAHSITYEEGRSALFKGQAPLQLSPTKKPYMETQTDEPEVPESRISQIKQRLSRKVSPNNVNENVLYSPKRSRDSNVGGVSSIPRVPYTLAEGSSAGGDSVVTPREGHLSPGSDDQSTSPTSPNSSIGPNETGKGEALQHSPTKASPSASIIASKGAIAALARGPKTKTVKVVPIPSKVKIEAPRIRAPESGKVVSPNGTSARNCFNGVGNVVNHATAHKDNDFDRVIDNVDLQVRFIVPDVVMNRVGRDEDVPNPFRADDFNKDEIDAICQQATAVAANIARAVTPDTISNLSSPSIDSIDTLLSKVRVSSDDVEGMNFGPSVSEAGPSLSNDVSMESIQQWSLSDDSEAKNALNTNSNDASVPREGSLGRSMEESIGKSIFKDVHSVIIEECESDKDVDCSTLDTEGLSPTDNVQYCCNGRGETNGNVSKTQSQTHLILKTGTVSQDINESNANEIKPSLEISSHTDAETIAVKCSTVIEETKSNADLGLSLELPCKNKALNSLSSRVEFTSSRKHLGSLESNDDSSDHSESEFFAEAPSPSDILDLHDSETIQHTRVWEDVSEQGTKNDQSSRAAMGNELGNLGVVCGLHLPLNKTNDTITKPGVNQNECVGDHSHQSSEEDGSDGSFCSAVSPGDLLQRDISTPCAIVAVTGPTQTETCTPFVEIKSQESELDKNSSQTILVSTNSAPKDVLLTDKEMIGGTQESPITLETSVNKMEKSCSVNESGSKKNVNEQLNNSESNEKQSDKNLQFHGTVKGNLINGNKKDEKYSSKKLYSDQTNEKIPTAVTESNLNNISIIENFTVQQNDVTVSLDPTKSSFEITKPINSSPICDIVNGNEPKTDKSVLEKISSENIHQPPVKKVSNIVSLFSNKDDEGGVTLRPASPLKPVTVKLRTSIPVLRGDDTKEELGETKSGQVCANVPGNTNSLMKYKKLKTFSSRKAIFEQLEKTTVSEQTVRRSSLKDETETNSKQAGSVNSSVSPGGSQSARSSPDKELQKRACHSIAEERKLQKVESSPTDLPRKNLVKTPIVHELTSENVTAASNLDIDCPKVNSSCDSDVESISSISAHLEKEVPLRISSPESDFDTGSIKTSIKPKNVSRSKMPKYNPGLRNLNNSKIPASDSTIKKANQIGLETDEAELVTSERESTASRVVRSPRTCMKFGRKTTPPPNVDNYSKSNTTFTDGPDGRRKLLKTSGTVSTSSEISSTTEVPADMRNRTMATGSKLKKRSFVTNKETALSSHKSSSLSTDTSTAEEIFYKSSLEIKLQGLASRETTSSTEFDRRGGESHLLRSKVVKPGSAFRQPSARYVKKIELKSFSKEYINESETSVSSQENATCLSSSTASMSSVETEGSNDCDLSQLIENLEKEHDELRAKSRSSTPRKARANQSRVRKVPRVQKLISRFEKP